jgi:hypothetical protein
MRPIRKVSILCLDRSSGLRRTRLDQSNGEADRASRDSTLSYHREEGLWWWTNPLERAHSVHAQARKEHEVLCILVSRSQADEMGFFKFNICHPFVWLQVLIVSPSNTDPPFDQSQHVTVQKRLEFKLSTAYMISSTSVEKRHWKWLSQQRHKGPCKYK